MEPRKVVVIGGGISGLAAAYRLSSQEGRGRAPLDVVLLEGSSRLGGIISTEQYEGSVIENGPDAFITTKPEALDLCRQLGLGDHIIGTNPHFRRAFVARKGRLIPLPEGFVMMAPTKIFPLMESPLFSLPGKLRMLLEVAVPARQDMEDESLADFVRRRLGKEALERAAQPMLAGIYTADPERLSLGSTMPQFLAYEAEFGSVIVGLQQEAKMKERSGDAGARYSLFVTLDSGLGLLVETLHQRVGPSKVRTNCPVSGLSRAANKWLVHLAEGEKLEADAVVLATPSGSTAKLLLKVDAELSSACAALKSASSLVLNMVYKRGDVPNRLDGFGFVVPQAEKRSIIACTYSSVKFAGRAPADMVTLRTFLGGAVKANLAKLNDTEALSLVQRDLRHYLGIRTAPVWAKVAPWPESMPQYEVGHEKRIVELEQALSQFPGLFFAGAAYRGVGLPDCIRSGQNAASLAIKHLESVSA
jgi:oxygen-dependent protoporphyrinogen oxidase